MPPIRLTRGLIEICAPWIELGRTGQKSVEAAVIEWVRRHFGPKRGNTTSRLITFCAPDGKVDDEVDVDRDVHE